MVSVCGEDFLWVFLVGPLPDGNHKHKKTPIWGIDAKPLPIWAIYIENNNGKKIQYSVFFPPIRRPKIKAAQLDGRLKFSSQAI